MSVNINFRTDSRTEFAEVLKQSQLSTTFMKYIVDLLETPNETLGIMDVVEYGVDRARRNVVRKFDLTKLDLKKFLVNLIDEKYYKKNNFIKNNIYKYIEFYFLNLMNLKYSRNKINSYYSEFIQKIYDLKKFNLDEESFFIELKTKILNG